MNKYKILIVCFLAVAFVANYFTCNAFTDVPEHEWYAESIEYVFEKGLMNGTGGDLFEPESKVTRGMIVTILYRFEGSPETVLEPEYTDVSTKDYFYKPIAWASENELVNGYNEAIFGPNDSITREQFATILYRYIVGKVDMKYVEYENVLRKYFDAQSVSNYAKEAMAVANEYGIIKGVTETHLEPQGYATRAQTATIFMRLNKIMESGLFDNSNDSHDVQTEIDKDDEDHQTTLFPSSSHVNSTSKREKTSIFVDDITVKAEDVFTLDVLVENNPGILGMSLIVEYDEDILTLVEAENGTAMSKLSFTKPGIFKSGAMFLWDGVELSEDDVRDGAILTLTFEAMDIAVDTTCTVEVSSPNNDIFDDDLTEVKPIFKKGRVTVSGTGNQK